MDWVVAAIVVTIVIGVAVAFFFLGRRGVLPHVSTERLGLEEYDFYPFVVNTEGHVEFDGDLFSRAVRHLLTHRNERAGRELIVIGEQNQVRDVFPTDALLDYKRLYAQYDGDKVISDTDAYLENYKRLVNQLGRSFPNTGIEILLHNLVNPAHSLVAIENGAVTGRQIGGGATNLVLDLKTRRQQGEDKVNYGLNIGSRQFKCTTVPIFRPEYGLVGAICVNVDSNFIRDAATRGPERLDAFIDNLLRTDFEIDENILSKDEYRLAMRGKRHFMDDAVRIPASVRHERRLAAIMFSDIVGFTALMGADEATTLSMVEANEEIHMKAFANHGGRLLKRLGDGLLASFDSASGAVECGEEIQNAVARDGRFQVRIGIHLGEVIESDGDVQGDGVNIASRIQSEVAPGEIGFSSVVYDNIKNKVGLSASPLGERKLKNLDSPMLLYILDRAD
ncbi:MAG TPA: PAS domain-containing protein [Acidimicrobiia bacterium]